LLEVDFGLGMDFTEDHTDRVLDCTFTCDLGVWILGETSVQNRVRNIVAQLVGVTAGDVLRGKEEMACFNFVIHRCKS